MPRAPKAKHFEPLMKWENSPGLDHHCGVCATPLSSPRALNTCIGKHSEPCYRFHQQLHLLKRSQDCDGCKSQDDSHRKRHKAIINCLREIKRHDAEVAATQWRPERKKPRNGPKEENSLDRGEGSDSYKAILRSIDGISEHIITENDILDISEKLHGKSDWDQTMGFEIDEEQELQRLETHTTKSGNYETKVDITEMALHPKGAHAAIDSPSNGNKSKKAGPRYVAMAAMRFHSFGRRAAPPTNTLNLSGVDPRIVERLGVQILNAFDIGRIRKELVTKLASAVALDLDCVEREQREIELREAAFWRYVSRTTFFNMRDRHDAFSWSTGQRKEPRKSGSLPECIPDDAVPDHEEDNVIEAPTVHNPDEASEKSAACQQETEGVDEPRAQTQDKKIVEDTAENSVKPTLADVTKGVANSTPKSTPKNTSNNKPFVILRIITDKSLPENSKQPRLSILTPKTPKTPKQSSPCKREKKEEGKAGLYGNRMP